MEHVNSSSSHGTHDEKMHLRKKVFSRAEIIQIDRVLFLRSHEVPLMIVAEIIAEAWGQRWRKRSIFSRLKRVSRGQRRIHTATGYPEHDVAVFDCLESSILSKIRQIPAHLPIERNVWTPFTNIEEIMLRHWMVSHPQHTLANKAYEYYHGFRPRRLLEVKLDKLCLHYKRHNFLVQQGGHFDRLAPRLWTAGSIRLKDTALFSRRLRELASLPHPIEEDSMPHTIPDSC